MGTSRFSSSLRFASAYVQALNQSKKLKELPRFHFCNVSFVFKFEKSARVQLSCIHHDSSLVSIYIYCAIKFNHYSL